MTGLDGGDRQRLEENLASIEDSRRDQFYNRLDNIDDSRSPISYDELEEMQYICSLPPPMARKVLQWKLDSYFYNEIIAGRLQSRNNPVTINVHSESKMENRSIRVGGNASGSVFNTGDNGRATLTKQSPTMTEEAMDPISFVVTTLAGAVLKKLGDDSYSALKAKIVALIGGTGVQAVEAKPESPAARALLAEQIGESQPALRDAELPVLATRVADALAALPEEEPLGGGITVRDIRAGRDIMITLLQANPGGGISIDGLRASGQVRIEGLVAGWKPADD